MAGRTARETARALGLNVHLAGSRRRRDRITARTVIRWAAAFVRSDNGRAANLLRLLSRIFLGVDVGNPPWATAVNLDDRFFVGKCIMRHARLEREEAAGRQRLGIALLRNVAHAEDKGTRDNGYD